jgi:hypothetical protein
MEVNIDMKNRIYDLQVHIQELKGELETFCKHQAKFFKLHQG